MKKTHNPIYIYIKNTCISISGDIYFLIQYIGAHQPPETIPENSDSYHGEIIYKWLRSNISVL